jgi:hypothetical protein
MYIWLTCFSYQTSQETGELCNMFNECDSPVGFLFVSSYLPRTLQKTLGDVMKLRNTVANMYGGNMQVLR